MDLIALQMSGLVNDKLRQCCLNHALILVDRELRLTSPEQLKSQVSTLKYVGIRYQVPHLILAMKTTIAASLAFFASFAAAQQGSPIGYASQNGGTTGGKGGTTT